MAMRQLIDAAEKFRERIMTMPMEIILRPDSFNPERIEVAAIFRLGRTKFVTSIVLTKRAYIDVPVTYLKDRLRYSLCQLLIKDIAFYKPKGRLPE
jgi:hypothetical protein